MLLRNRDYRLLLAGQAVSLLGDGMISVALAFAALELDAGPTAVGLVFAARMAPMVACLLVGGVVADRVSPRVVMIGADLVRVASQGTMAALLLSDQASLASLCLLAAIGGAASGFFNPAATGLLPAVVAPEDLQQANGLRGTAQGVGEISGPIIAGVLVATAGAGWAIAIDAATFALSAVCLVLLRIAPRAQREAAHFLTDLREGWSAFIARSWVWTFVVAAALGNLFWATKTALGPGIAEDSLGGAAAWGAAQAAVGLGGLIGGVWAIRIRPGRPMVWATIATALFALPLPALAIPAPLWIVVATFLLSGLGLMLGNTIWESTLQKHVPQDQLGRVSSYDWFGSLAFYPIGLAIWGPIAAGIGVSTSLWIAFVLQMGVIVAVLAVREVRELR